MIALRADHQIDRRRAADDLSAFGLRHAAGDRDDDDGRPPPRRPLEAGHAAELGIHLLRRLLADVAGVQDDEIGVFGVRGLDIALRAKVSAIRWES